MYFANYLSDRMPNLEDIRRLREIEGEYGDALKEKDAESHFGLKLNTWLIKVAEDKTPGPIFPSFIYEFFYSMTSMFAGVTSAVFLGLGMFCLWLSVFF